MKARNQSSSPVSSTMMCCPVSGPVTMFEYDRSRVSAPNNSIFKHGAKGEFEALVNEIGGMEYGQKKTVSMEYLSSFASSYFHKGKWHNPADILLSNIMGSSFEYVYDVNSMHAEVTFSRLANGKNKVVKVV